MMALNFINSNAANTAPATSLVRAGLATASGSTSAPDASPAPSVPTGEQASQSNESCAQTMSAIVKVLAQVVASYSGGAGAALNAVGDHLAQQAAKDAASRSATVPNGPGTAEESTAAPATQDSVLPPRPVTQPSTPVSQPSDFPA